jgi:hypothetical protein
VVAQVLVLTIAAAVALLLLCGVMLLVHRHALGGLESLRGLAADGLLGQARSLVPQPLAGSPFELLVDALDRGDPQLAQGAWQRVCRRAGRVPISGWHVIALLALPSAGIPLAPAVFAGAAARLDSAHAGADAWAGATAGLLATGTLVPLALAVATLAFHLAALEEGRRTSAAAALLHHSGKELR